MMWGMHPNPCTRYRSLVKVCVAAMSGSLVFPLVQTLNAADGTWNTTVSGSQWSVSDNWAGSTIADGADAVANFSTLDLSSDTTVLVDSPRTIGGMVFADTNTGTVGGWVLTGSTLTLSTTSGTPTITVNTLGSSSGVQRTALLNTVLTGSQGLTKEGSGILVLNANNTFSGTLNVNAGTLRLGNGSSAGTVQGDIVVASGAILQFDRNVNGGYTVANNISGGGTVTKTNGSGQLTLSGNNTYTGGTNLSTGALFVTGNTSLGTGLLKMSQGTRFGSSDNTSRTIANALDFSAVGNGQNVTFGAGAGATNGLGDLIFTATNSVAAPSGSGTVTIHNSTSVTFNQVFTGGGRFTKLGTGTLVLAGASTYTGLTTVRNGTLVAGSNAPSGSAGAFGNATSAIVLADVSSAATDNVALLINGGHTVGRAITVNNNNSTGTTTIGATNAAGTTATYSGAITLNRNVALTSATAGATTVFSGGIGEDLGGARGVVINGGANEGTVIFTGANTYTGGTTVGSGTFLVNGAGTAGSGQVVVNSGALIGGSGSVGAVTFNAGAGLAYDLADAGQGGDGLTVASFTGAGLSSFTVFLTGAGADFDAGQDYQWTILTSDSSVTLGGITVDTSGFGQSFTGAFNVSFDANSIYLNYVASAIPEPSSYAALAGAALLGFAATRRRRRE